MDDLREKLALIGRQFSLPGTPVEWEQMTSGHINTAWRVVFEDCGRRNVYLVQQVNCYVFRDPVSMMRNIEQVTSHLAAKAESGDTRSCLHYCRTAGGDSWILLGEGDSAEFWRVCGFIEDAVSFEAGEGGTQALHMAGRAFGRFARQLSDFDAGRLVESIPHFHDTPLRLETLFRHAAEDPCGRAAQCRAELETIAAHREFACCLSERLRSGELPLRVTHNDTKTNNVLFDRSTLEPLAVIDLDTVMPGLLAHDFGDAVRFAASRGGESEADPERMTLDIDRFKAFAEGYIGEALPILSPAELHSLAVGVPVITLELAARFLDDYLTGDRYFRTRFPEHNLVRTRSQLALFADQFRRLEDMERMVLEIAGQMKDSN